MSISEQLVADGLIDAATQQSIEQEQRQSLFSLHWELRLLLYLGIVLFSGGLAVLVYKNIDSIGHQVIIAVIALACAFSFRYVVRHRLPYVPQQVQHPSVFFDYIVLLACLLLGTLFAYVQYQYALFGRHHALATAIPTIVFAYAAYRFDHKALLSMAISGVATIIGLSITPLNFIYSTQLLAPMAWSAIALGLALLLWDYLSAQRQIKTHFSFTFHHFAAHLLFVADLQLLFDTSFKWLSLLLLFAFCAYFIRYAIKQQSFWFLLLSVLYTYIGISYCVFKVLFQTGDALISLGLLYVLASCIGVVLFFVHYKKILAYQHDRL